MLSNIIKAFIYAAWYKFVFLPRYKNVIQFKKIHITFTIPLSSVYFLYCWYMEMPYTAICCFQTYVRIPLLSCKVGNLFNFIFAKQVHFQVRNCASLQLCLNNCVPVTKHQRVACVLSAVYFTAVQNFEVVSWNAKEIVKSDNDSEDQGHFHSLLSAQLAFISYKIFVVLVHLAKCQKHAF